jgi:hypothetical protein
LLGGFKVAHVEVGAQMADTSSWHGVKKRTVPTRTGKGAKGPSCVFLAGGDLARADSD